jgi:LuxR family maltose regulon positive regulatory protein
MRMWATAALAHLDVRTGREPSQAARRLRDSWSIVAGHPMSAYTATRVAYAQHRCSWLVGRPDWAQEALAHLSDHVGPGGEMDVLTAAEHLARGRGAAARRRLAPVLDESTPCLMPTTLQHGLLIEAVLGRAASELAHAHAALRRALVIAEETGAAHAFLDVPGVTELLEDNSGRFGRLDSLADHIRLTAPAQSEREHIPLTVKELGLLNDLPAPLTFEEIAQRHQVSINTVKTHVRSIYQKLASGSRREAIATARRRGML